MTALATTSPAASWAPPRRVDKNAAIDRVENSPVDQLIVTNTVPLSGVAQQCKKIVVLSVARLLGQAIRSIHEETSVSSLFV